MVVKGSLKAKITPSLHISSKNLQISDLIGQGKTEKWTTLCITINFSHELFNYIIHDHAGEFGIVYKGYLVDRFTTEIVAIKTLKGMPSYMLACGDFNGIL